MSLGCKFTNMNNLLIKAVFSFVLCIGISYSQNNNLPLKNGRLETPGTATIFSDWENRALNGGVAQYSIESSDVAPESNRCLKSHIEILTDKGYEVNTKYIHPFSVINQTTYTVSFFAKFESSINTVNSATLKLAFNSTDGSNPYQGKNFNISNTWERYTFELSFNSNSNQNTFSIWYLTEGVTFYIDNINLVEGTAKHAWLNSQLTNQTLDGFGGGIKRRTEDLYALPESVRTAIETLCFKDLNVNMIRFFVYHDLEEPENDNNDPYVINETALDWRRYEDNPQVGKSKYVVNVLNDAFALSEVGFDHVIGNCNSPSGWMKINQSFKRLSNEEPIEDNTLISGYEDEFSEFLITFLKGMKSRYDIDVTAISPTNEPDFMNTYESMNTPPNQLAGILKNLDNRLSFEGLDHIKIIAPECAGVAPTASALLTNINSTTSYISSLFNNANTKDAIDVIGTHTYYDSDHTADWTSLKSVGQNKPLWVTESANLGSTDISMTDAAHYIKWMIRGFNKGGMTGYMTHLFFEGYKYPDPENPNAKTGASALVYWTNNNEIVVPKRYYSFKHFSNLLKPGDQHMETFSNSNDIWTLGFKSESTQKLIVSVFNEGPSSNIQIDTPINAHAVSIYSTSDESSNNFSFKGNVTLTADQQSISRTMASHELLSLVFEISNPLNIENTFKKNNYNLISLLQNPIESELKIQLEYNMNLNATIYQIDGKVVLKTQIDTKHNTINCSSLSSGLYFLRVKDTKSKKSQTVKFLKH